jgi:integrase/recombinase XerD
MSRMDHSMSDRSSLSHWVRRFLMEHLLRAFLQSLEKIQAVKIITRNQRLATIRALAKFVGGQCPEYLKWSGQIRLVPFKRHETTQLTYLERDEMEALLDAPDRTTAQGQREYALVLFLYNSGARASETVGITKEDVTWNTDNRSVRFMGKGKKVRSCPLWKETLIELEQLIRGRSDTDRLRQPLWKSADEIWSIRCSKSVTLKQLRERCQGF